MRLLLLEDDQQLGKALQAALSQNEFQAVWVRRVVDALSLLDTDVFSVVLLDIGLPDGSGLDVLKWLRKNNKTMPIIMLTARDAVQDRIDGLDLGADDYLAKPFSVPELISRIRAVARRSAGFAESIWRVGELSIDPSRHCAMISQVPIDLSLREYTLLVELVRNAGKYVTRSRLEGVLFGLNNQLESNALEVHMHNLRKKVGDVRIRTIRGVGYLLETDA
jgi:two-component system, OmpR family, response regulator QseB